MASKSPGLKRKQMVVTVLMLDDTEIPFQIDSKITGIELVNQVYEYLKLVESDYFGLEYYDTKRKKCWLDYDKSVVKQLQNDSKLIFGVKFYTPDPGQLEEEYTRYLYALQIKRDLAEGLLLCSDATASLLVSYILQAEIGDYLDSFNDNPNYFNNRRYFPHQGEEHSAKIIDYHKSHIGQTPADADLNLLDIARKVELYGVIMHPAKDHEGVQLNLAVANMGILVFQNYTKINTFSWAKIRKLSFRRKKFLVKLHSENYGFYKDTVEFYFDNRDDSKSFWKKCIEHHSFFRCLSIMHMPRQKTKLFATRGSSFRYYGRTQKELIESARENFSKNRLFDRSYHSIRSMVTGLTNNPPINGTQSLNRNLASRSAGALMVPSTGGCGSSTLSSNESDQNYNLSMNQNTSSSAHHLSYNIPQQAAEIKSKASNGNTEKSAISLRSLDEQKLNDLNNKLSSLNDSADPGKPKVKHRYLHDDTSTHGSRTIDSRYSNDKTLGLSDGEDEDENDEEDGNDEDGFNDEMDEVKQEDQVYRNFDAKEGSQLVGTENAVDMCQCGEQHEKEDQDLNESTNKYFSNNTPCNLKRNEQNQQSTFQNDVYGSKSLDIIQKPSILQQQKNHNALKLRVDVTGSNHTTDNELPIHTNPNNSSNLNKIYSRKEVITTSYKEEIKNTHLEEYHHTTTIYDTPGQQTTNEPNQASSLLLRTLPKPTDQLDQASCVGSALTGHNLTVLTEPKPYSMNSQKQQLNHCTHISSSPVQQTTNKSTNFTADHHIKYDQPADINDDNDGKRLKNLQNKISISSSNVSCSCSNHLNKANRCLMSGNFNEAANENTCCCKQASSAYENRTYLDLYVDNDCKFEEDSPNLLGDRLGAQQLPLNLATRSVKTGKAHHKHHHHHSKHKQRRLKKEQNTSVENLNHLDEIKLKINKKDYRDQYCKNTNNNKHTSHQSTENDQNNKCIKKLSKTPIFVTSTLGDSMPPKKSKKSTNSKKAQENLILISDNDNKIKNPTGTKPKNVIDHPNIMSMSEDYGSDWEDHHQPKKKGLLCSSSKPVDDYNFSLSSSVSTSSLSYLKDLPLELLSSSSSSDYSFLTKSRRSSSSSIQLSMHDSSSADSLKISMAELNQLSNSLNKKILKTLKHDSKNKKYVSEKRSEKKKPVYRVKDTLLIDNSDTSIAIKRSDNELDSPDGTKLLLSVCEDRNSMVLVSPKKKRESKNIKLVSLDRIRSKLESEQFGLLLEEQRPKQKLNTKKKHRNTKSKNPASSNDKQPKFKSLPRMKKAAGTIDYGASVYSYLDDSVNDQSFSQPHQQRGNYERVVLNSELSKMQQTCSGSDFRKVINKFDLSLTSSMTTNGSTPYKTRYSFKTNEKPCGFIEETLKNSESILATEIVNNHESILEDSVTSNRIYLPEDESSVIIDKNGIIDQTGEVLTRDSETNGTDSNDKTIRQILDKIVEAKLQVISSNEELLKNQNFTTENVCEPEVTYVKEDDGPLNESIKINSQIIMEESEKNESSIEVCKLASAENLENNEMLEEAELIDQMRNEMTAASETEMARSEEIEQIEKPEKSETELEESVAEILNDPELNETEENSIEDDDDLRECDAIEKAPSIDKDLESHETVTEINTEIKLDGSKDVDDQVTTEDDSLNNISPEELEVQSLNNISPEELEIQRTEISHLDNSFHSESGQCQQMVKARCQQSSSPSDGEIEARIIKKTVYKVLEKATEIVAAEYNSSKVHRKCQNLDSCENVTAKSSDDCFKENHD